MLFIVFAVTAMAALLGDVNKDGKVDIIDIGIIVDNYGLEPLRYLGADLNKDAEVSIVDLGIAIDNYGNSESDQHTPHPSSQPQPTSPSGGGDISPYPNAPLCPDSGTAHNVGLFHTLWDSERGCHYDHEHGENPFTNEVSSGFPGLNLFSLLGNVGVGHTNPSSPMENTHKHAGFKWQVQPNLGGGCVTGFEGANIAVNAAVIQYHAFGNYAHEFDSRVHSGVALMRQCLPGSTDYGYVYTVQHIDYGQRVSAYQGDIIPYADNPQPSYPAGSAPYFTVDCIGRGAPPCGRYQTFEEYKAANGNTSTTWTSKTPQRIAPSGSPLFMLLFRARDTFQILDWSDTTQPFTFRWMCSNDGGQTFNQRPGCRHNNTTTRVHEIAGTIPASWDNLGGFDTDSRNGRITGSGFTTRFGNLNRNCTAVGVDCHPIKLVGAYIGQYGASLAASGKGGFSREDLPERDIYFCSGRECAETDPSAVSAGWIGANN